MTEVPTGRSGDPRRVRVAYSLIEVVVALTIILILAAVTVPSLAGYLDKQRVDATADLLASVRDGLTAAGGFRQTVGANAGQLSELTTQIWNSKSGPPPFPTNSCGSTFSNGQVNSWDNGGPYVGFFVPATGLPTPIGVANDSLVRVPPTNAPGTLRVEIPGVSLQDAILFDATADGSSGSASGMILWSAPVADQVTLQYLIPVDNRC